MNGAPVSDRAASRSDTELARVVRGEAARVVSALHRSFGDLDVAEEATSSAIEEALRAWRRDGVPPRPGAWLMTAARHDALDLVRRSRRYREKVEAVAATAMTGAGEDVPAPAGEEAEEVLDERLPLLFGCCHPAIAPAGQLALTLRAVVGLTKAQIARATVEPESTVAQRIVRAKRKIAASGIPLRVPRGRERAARLDLVLTVVSVMYDAAQLRDGESADPEHDLADDALWLAGVIAFCLPDEAEAHGLRALLHFHRARGPARVMDGSLVPLDAQDRSLWDAADLATARRALERAGALRRPGRWQLHAAIAACHTDAQEAADTDWPQILALYDLLLVYDPSPLVRLNRAVALAECAGPRAGLDEVEAVRSRLEGYRLWHAVRAALLRRIGRADEARAADERARQLSGNDAERRLLDARIAAAGVAG
ncbi:RNA polymerase sigma factor [Microbacterium resistens]|uniref:RNA polymerase sigma factor n=1 Tax=Microbacterium resistens TaxID=156977 RepID=UPI00366E18F3